MIVERITVIFAGDRDVAAYTRFRALAGQQGMNKLVKRLIQDWLKGQPNGSKPVASRMPEAV